MAQAARKFMGFAIFIASFIAVVMTDGYFSFGERVISWEFVYSVSGWRGVAGMGEQTVMIFDELNIYLDLLLTAPVYSAIMTAPFLMKRPELQSSYMRVFLNKLLKTVLTVTAVIAVIYLIAYIAP
ncbi:hypothetical protein [Pantoea coffeiphila]|uniref:Uncharacterized protein n=1 Tax=Pantoea coffeiphila TaxID=1465635 RepID=A0A2S9IAY2_9GAMM|nr:hypothetical protein [Pantoea coffeiphila]PRD14884.1 hypothetical protein CQW29_13050 [Pantoea coffeiphila]